MGQPLSVVHVGVPMDHPVVVDRRETVTARLETHRQAMVARGLRYELAFHAPEGGLEAFAARLRAHRWDAVVIGAGVVGSRELAHFMERLVDATHVEAPQAKILFIHDLADVVPALGRWFGPA